MTFFRWEGTVNRVGCNFYIKNKLKSEIFNDEKVYEQMFFPVITKNLNLEVLTKNLVTYF